VLLLPVLLLPVLLQPVLLLLPVLLQPVLLLLLVLLVPALLLLPVLLVPALLLLPVLLLPALLLPVLLVPALLLLVRLPPRLHGQTRWCGRVRWRSCGSPLWRLRLLPAWLLLLLLSCRAASAAVPQAGSRSPACVQETEQQHLVSCLSAHCTECSVPEHTAGMRCNHEPCFQQAVRHSHRPPEATDLVPTTHMGGSLILPRHPSSTHAIVGFT
jgi:hypothetical protein